MHFSFGLLLAYPIRDWLMNHFNWPRWVCWVLPVEITLSFWAAYELIEWAVAGIFFPAHDVAYLGKPGDARDARKDMGLAFSVAALSMVPAGTAKRMSQRPSN